MTTKNYNEQCLTDNQKFNTQLFDNPVTLDRTIKSHGLGSFNLDNEPNNTNTEILLSGGSLNLNIDDYKNRNLNNASSSEDDRGDIFDIFNMFDDVDRQHQVDSYSMNRPNNVSTDIDSDEEEIVTTADDEEDSSSQYDSFFNDSEIDELSITRHDLSVNVDNTSRYKRRRKFKGRNGADLIGIGDMTKLSDNDNFKKNSINSAFKYKKNALEFLSKHKDKNLHLFQEDLGILKLTENGEIPTGAKSFYVTDWKTVYDAALTKKYHLYEHRDRGERVKFHLDIELKKMNYPLVFLRIFL